MGVPGVGVEGAPGGGDPLLAVRLFLLSDFLFFLFFLLARAPGHSPRPQPPFFSFLARAQSGIGGGEGGIPSKESLGAILERRGGEPHIDRPTKKEKGTLPSLLLPKRDGSLFPLIGTWQPGTTLESRHVTSHGRKAKKDSDQFKVPLKVFVPFIAPLYFAEYV